MPAAELRASVAQEAWEFAKVHGRLHKQAPEAFADGARAYAVGRPISSNPFSTHPDRGCPDPEQDPYVLWISGWQLAQTVHRERLPATILPVNEATMVPTPYRQGGQAFFDGFPIGRNPFQIEPSKREWDRGWQSAKDFADNESADGT